MEMGIAQALRHLAMTAMIIFSKHKMFELGAGQGPFKETTRCLDMVYARTYVNWDIGALGWCRVGCMVQGWDQERVMEGYTVGKLG